MHLEDSVYNLISDLVRYLEVHAQNARKAVLYEEQRLAIQQTSPFSPQILKILEKGLLGELGSLCDLTRDLILVHEYMQQYRSTIKTRDTY